MKTEYLSRKLLILALVTLLGSATIQAAILDFETINGNSPYEGVAISNQFSGTFGMRFTSLDGLYYPSIVEVGHPGLIFGSPGGDFDAILSKSPEKVGHFFLGDATSNLEPGDKGFVVRFDSPVSKFNFDILDLDGSEAVTVKAYSSENPITVISTNTYYATNRTVFGDSIAVRVGISTETKSIVGVRVSNTVNVGYDNFETDFAPAQQQEATLSIAPAFSFTGSIGTPYRIDYAENNGIWHPLSTNYATAELTWFIDRTQPVPQNRIYRVVGIQ